MLSKGRVAMTPDKLSGAARNLAHGLGIPVYIRDSRTTYRTGSRRSYRQAAPDRQLPMTRPIKKRSKKRTRQDEWTSSPADHILGARLLICRLRITPAPSRPPPIGEGIIESAAARTPDPEDRGSCTWTANPCAWGTIRNPTPGNGSPPLAQMIGHLLRATAPCLRDAWRRSRANRPARRSDRISTAPRSLRLEQVFRPLRIRERAIRISGDGRSPPSR